jgi:hypothetical protein
LTLKKLKHGYLKHPKRNPGMFTQVYIFLEIHPKHVTDIDELIGVWYIVEIVVIHGECNEAG